MADPTCPQPLLARCWQVASSSRSQVRARTASAAVRLTCERPSVGVHWRPPLAMVIVTHLVTRSLPQLGAALGLSMGARGVPQVTRPSGTPTLVANCRQRSQAGLRARACYMSNPAVPLGMGGLRDINGSEGGTDYGVVNRVWVRAYPLQDEPRR
jgi:hypothetical protein